MESDIVIGIRGAAEEIVRAAANSGTVRKTHFYPDADSAAEFIKGEIRNGDLVSDQGLARRAFGKNNSEAACRF